MFSLLPHSQMSIWRMSLLPMENMTQLKHEIETNSHSQLTKAFLGGIVHGQNDYTQTQGN